MVGLRTVGFRRALFTALACVVSDAMAAHEGSPRQLAGKLVQIRSQSLQVEKSLGEGIRNEKQIKSNLGKIRALMNFQRREREIHKKRMNELEHVIDELETRRNILGQKIKVRQESVRKFLISINNSLAGHVGLEPGNDKLEAPSRRVLAGLADLGLKELEALTIDVADAERLETKVNEEKEQLAYLLGDLNEQESIMELNRQLQADFLNKNNSQRASQLSRFRKLKEAQGQVEQLISQFSARRELEREVETERAASKAMARGAFGKLKGLLTFPVKDGKVTGSFGKAFDPDSRLYVFKKGVEILGAKKSTVVAVGAGRVVFSGEIPDYGRTMIIDHGGQYYSLYAHMGELDKNLGDSLKAGDRLGRIDDAGTPVYFEIRSRNIALNPLQWISN